MGENSNFRVIVQSDWEASLRKSGCTAWVSYRKSGDHSIHGELKCAGMSSLGKPSIDGTNGFSVKDVTMRSLTVSYNDLHHCKFMCPAVTFSEVHAKSVESLDVTPGGLAVSADVTGKCRIWTTEEGEVRRTLAGHVGDVYSCRFFPSGTVVLTGGADTQLKIWSAEDGKCAATLTGHQAGISSTAVVERGRNIVSCSRDGTAKLWDCGQQTCLTTWSELGGAINDCAVGAVGNRSVNLGQPNQPPSEREVLTEGKLLLLATESGQLRGFGLQSRKPVFSVKCEEAVNCCSLVTDNTVVCGTQDSEILVIDLRNTNTPLKRSKEMRSAILSFLPHNQGFFTSTGDGSCFYTDETLETNLELTGSDCDPVYKVVKDSSYLYTCCRDSYIRKYKI